MPSTPLDQLSLNTIRFLAVDAIQKANSGHPGLPMGAAPMAYVVWTRFLRHSPANPNWFDRDRFVLSAGHGSMLLYALLHLTGYQLPLAELQNFRQWGSRTPGHLERGPTPGVETTTGPLGQGFANGVGMAIAEAYLAAHFNRPGHEIVNHRVYGIVSDGDLMEGVASEAASIAGHLRLGKIIYLYDDNRISLAGATALTFTEDVSRRFEAYGWHTQTVGEGNDLDALSSALRAAQAETSRPSLISVRTTIGYGAPHKQNTFEAHGSPLGPDEVRAAKQNLGWPAEPPFLIPGEALEHFREAVTRGQQLEAEWRARFESYRREYPALAAELERMAAGELPPGWAEDIPTFPADVKGVATRAAGREVLNTIAPKLPELIGGSADLNPSTYTVIKGAGDFQSPDSNGTGGSQTRPNVQGAVGGGWDYAGRNLHFGVREHGMGGIVNGMAMHGGVRPYSATFLIFSDYMRPAVRLAAISEAPSIFIFTHDSIGLGEDGPTHQPVEHLAALRAIPNLVVIRPCDANETAEAWRVAIEHRHGPVALAFTRQNVPTLDRAKFAPASGLAQGAYVLLDSGRAPEVILIATGSEVELIVRAGEKLAAEGLAVRLVSMPSWELFASQPQAYRDSVLPPGVTARVAVEAGVRQGWERWIGERGAFIGLDRYGASAPYKVIYEKLGLTVERVAGAAQALVQ